MPKLICIFSDGTNQIGGIRPDQRLSNVYKLYRAMRPGPDSPIDPMAQVAFYDPGLGTGEGHGLGRRLSQMLESAIGTGFDHNIIDCYERIIAFYEPGDRVLLFGFSRGAYTVRALANVMNLCGIPTRTAEGQPVPKLGPELRKIASDAVRFVYGHGAGKPRGKEPYLSNREELGRRFRQKYGSAQAGGEDVRGNVEPAFIGVFDTVASLNTGVMIGLSLGALTALAGVLAAAIGFGWPWYVTVPLGMLAWHAVWRGWFTLLDSLRYFSPDPDRSLKLGNPLHWLEIAKTAHFSFWRARGVDAFLSPGVDHARHALAIDEARRSFPRVPWGMTSTARQMAGRDPPWLAQVWFAGCHSDIGGSYPERESRLSDIALDWMVEELRACMPGVAINEDRLHRAPDPLGIQHDERVFFSRWGIELRWPRHPRAIAPHIPLHPSVLTRMAADAVPQDDRVAPYRPEQLRDDPRTRDFY